MLLPEHDFQKPPSLSAAIELLGRVSAGSKLLAGGTDVIFNMRGRLFEPDTLISIKDIPELQLVEQLPDGSLAIGVGCRLTDLECHPLVHQYPGFVAAIRSVASRHVRNMATLGGNLNLDTRCWYTNQTAEWREAKGGCLKTGVDVCFAIRSSSLCVALNASDLAPALLALNVQVVLASVRGERTMHIADFYTEDGIAHTARAADEIMVRIVLPPAAGRMIYLKETARKGNDFAYATIAAWADGTDDQCANIRVVLGSLTTRPVYLKNVARLVEANGLSDSVIESAVLVVRDELGVLTNLYTPAAYKSRIARSLVRSALQQLRAIA
jgi:4-hydroxybenzoyl-CoA reductase subunit beta